ncbi:hypothetical protein RZS08_28065, partial [Arthrospira platensis SPKY1]|nr:hypothetical protein [Arthrospira platensis SPKY1]
GSRDIGEVQVQARHDRDAVGIGIERHATWGGSWRIERDVRRFQGVAYIHDDAIPVHIEVLQTELGDVRIPASGGGWRAGFRTRAFRAAQVDMECRGPFDVAGGAYAIDPDKLASEPPVPQHSGTVERRRRRGVVDVVEF